MAEKDKVVCSRCSGERIIKVPDPLYLEGLRLERCGCVYTEEDLNIPLRYCGKTFENFKGHLNLIKYLKTYIDSYVLGEKGLYFHGRNGVGKTHLALAVIKELAKTKGIRGKYTSSVDFLELDRESYKKEEIEEKVRSLELAEILVVDDLGVEKESEWVTEHITSLIDFRYRNYLTTIFTSNYSLENLKYKYNDEVFGFRISSRVAEMCFVLYLNFEDYRFKDFKETEYGK